MLQPAVPIQAIIQWFIEFWILWGPWLIPSIELILVWIALIILQGLVTSLLRRRVLHGGVPSDAINGLVIAIRLLFIWFGIVTLASFVPPLWAYTVTLVGSASVIIGLAVGLAISLAMRNFIAGLYVLFSDPFDVGDYVRIGSNEGIILEMSLNYTKLRQIDGSITLIPNNNVMNSAVTNFRFEQKKLLETDKKQEPEEDPSIPNRIWKALSKAVDTSKLIQYAFELQFPLAPGLNHYEEKLPNVMTRWTRKFGFKPDYVLSSTSNLAFTYTFTIFVEDPKLLLDSRFDFLEDITRAVY